MFPRATRLFLMRWILRFVPLHDVQNHISRRKSRLISPLLRLLADYDYRFHSVQTFWLLALTRQLVLLTSLSPEMTTLNSFHCMRVPIALVKQLRSRRNILTNGMVELSTLVENSVNIENTSKD